MSEQLESALLEILGKRPNFLPDSEDVPEVDIDKIMDLLEGRLGPYAREDVTASILCYRPWYFACLRALGERLRKVPR
jgi:hypothetical protein